MNVDISPNLPPSSSCTAAAPTGSGSDGGGSSACRRSMRRIMWSPRSFGRRGCGGEGEGLDDRSPCPCRKHLSPAAGDKHPLARACARCRHGTPRGAHGGVLDDPRGGNPAGVVVGDALPPTDAMQQIATDVGYSETAFLAGDGGAEWTARYFSPVAEVPFCGTPDRVRDRRPPSVRRDRAALRHARGAGAGHGGADRRRALGDADLGRAAGHGDRRGRPGVPALPAASHRGRPRPTLPPRVAAAGVRHPIVALASRDALTALEYDFDPLRALMEARDWTTIQVVWRSSPTQFRSRNPFPVGGVVEDPATGAAAAALGAYLREVGALSRPRRSRSCRARRSGGPPGSSWRSRARAGSA